MIEARRHYEEEGYVVLRDIGVAAELEPLQQLIYDITAPLIEPHDTALPLAVRLRLPFARIPSDAEWSHLMRTVNESNEFKNVVDAEGVRSTFASMLGVEPRRFPICVFRAQVPKQRRAVYRWHQDEGTWYAVPVATLAYKMPGTLWLSINGADTTNSIELIPRSHRCGLRLHRMVEGQGLFDADPPADLPEPVAMSTNPGDAVLFSALTFHRSIVAGSLAPRYSADLRYYDPTTRGEYQVDPMLLQQREATLAAQSASPTIRG